MTRSLLRRDGAQRVTEKFFVVETNGRDNRNGRGHNIGGVPAPAHPNLENGHVDRLFGEIGEGASRDGFEKCRLPHP